MAKKTKQPTFKEQVYQSIANSHVQQAVQNNGVAQLQAEYDAWKNQNGVQALQAEYDNWAKAQVPTQTPSVKATAPKTQSADNTVRFKTAAERRAIKAEQDKKLAPFDPEKSYAKRFGNNETAKEKKESFKQDSSIGGGVSQIPSLANYMNSMESTRTKDKVPVDLNQVKAELEKQEENQLYYERAKEYLNPNKKLTKEEAKTAKKLAIEGLKEFKNVDPKTLTPEELERKTAYEDLKAKSGTFIPLSIGAANKGVHMGLSLAKAALPSSTTNTINNLVDKWDEIAAPSIELAQGAAPITSVNVGDVIDVALGNPSALIPDSVWDKMTGNLGEADINPYETGEMATMLASYMITNPLFDKIAGGENASRLAKFAVNQLGQNLQDIALDTSQIVEQGLKDGSINADEAKQIRDNIFWNAVFNAVFGIGGEVIHGFGKEASNIADADNIVREATKQAPSANELYRQNALEGLDKMQKVNKGYEFGYHNSTPENVFRNADDITDATNKQFSDLMNEYKGEFKDDSAMRNIFTPEDLEAAQNDQFTALMKQRPQELPKTELPMDDSLKPIGEAPSLTGNNRPATFGFTPLQEEIESDLKVIAEPMNKLSTTGYMDNITDANAIKKWNDLNDAYDDYVMKTTFGGTYDEINNARKKMESTRKAFARAMEEIDPEVARSFNTSSYGKAVSRPAYKALGTELTPEQIERNYRAILEAEGYEPEQIEAMIKEADIRGNMNAVTSVDNTIESAAKTQQIDNINAALGKVNAGRTTYIKDFYEGPKPISLGSPERIEIAPDTYNRALDIYNSAKQGDSFAQTLRKHVKELYESKYKDPKYGRIIMNNVSFNDGDYVVEISHRALKEAIDKGHLSAEKIATLEKLDELLANGEFIDSGQPKYHGTTDKSQLVRYDYFETPIAINGQNYIVAFDVEVNKGGNRYKTHKVVNEINLIPIEGQGLVSDITETTAPKGLTDGIGVTPDRITGIPTQQLERSLSNSDITNAGENVNKNSVNFDGEKTIDMDLQHFGGDNPSEPNWKVSQAYTNTGKNGGGWTEAEYNKYTDPKHYVYESIDEEQSIKSAIDMRAKEGREAFKKRVMSAERMSSVEIDGLMMEWRETVEEARALEAAGKAKEADKLWWESNKIFRTIQEQSTDNAQALQALAKWSRNTPEGMLANAENIINGKVEPPKSELKKALDKWARRRKVKVEFSPEFEKEFLNEAEKIDGLHGAELDTPEAKEVMAKLGKMVNEQIPVKLSEKLQTYLMDSMLGNFRTLISRNAGGNIGLNAMEQVAQRPLAAGIDSLVAKKTGVRTQAGLSIEGLADYFEGFKKGLKDELSDVKTGLKTKSGFHTARSGENTLENAISSNRRIFKNKLMNLCDQLVRHGLSVGDRPFYESVYKQTLGDYQRLYDRGLMGEVVQSLEPDEFRAYAETAAHLNALSAVYQQDSMFSKGLMELKKGIGKLSQGAFGVDILSQFSMPFVKTPANVIERAIDYSPLGAIRNSLRTGAEIKAGAFDQNRFVNETARNILGTAGMGAGVGLAKNGVFSGSYSDDKDVKQAQKERGMQEYALNVPDGKQMDISWIPVLGSNMVASAAAYDAYNKGEGDKVSNLATGLEKGGEAMFDQSMFQGLQRLFGTGDTYDSDKGIVGNAGETIKSGLGQAIPSLARQTAQVLDPYQRDIANSNEGVSFGPMDNYNINSLANNLPGVREKYLAPKVDTQGNLMMENQGRNVGSKILEDMFLPGKLTEIKSDALNDEAQRLAEANNSNKAFIPKADRKVVDQEANEENEGHILTNEEWVDYQQKYYRALNDAGLKLIDSDYYKSLDDTEKEAILDNTYRAIRAAVNSEYTGKELDGASKAYVEAGGGEAGSKAVINYYTAKNYVEKAGTTMSSKTGESIRAAIGRNDYEAAERIADKNVAYKTAFEKYDMDNNEANKKIFDQYGEEGLKQLGSFKGYGDNQKKAFNIYQNAKSVIPGLSPEQFKTQYDAIDGSGSKGKDDGSVTQGEMISFLNEGNYTEAEAKKYWNAYGNAWQATLYKTKKGKWAYKTK